MAVDFNKVDHRPWPLPARKPAMRMSWHDLLFAHWPIPVNEMRKIVPESLPLDLYNGEAWIGIVPFWMSGVRLIGLPPVPGTSRFPEINVRTYVTLDGKPGVYFFSLDTTSYLAVRAARISCRLNYYDADISVKPDIRLPGRASFHGEDKIIYTSSRRLSPGDFPADFAASYFPTGPVDYFKHQDPLAAWFTERYCLYTTDRRNRVYRLEIHHVPWPLQPASAHITRNTMTAPLQLFLPDIPPLLHFSKRIDVAAWAPKRVR